MSVLGFFLRALDDLAAAPAPGLLLVTAPVAAASVDRLLATEPSLLWDAPAPEADGRAWSFLGWGEAARVEGMGEDRFEAVRRGAKELFGTVSERRHPELGSAVVPAPRLFGGVAFRAAPEHPAPWTSFGDASFTFPRWLYATNGERAVLRLAVRPGERIALAEIESALARIESAAPASAAPSNGGSRGARVERLSLADWSAMIDDALGRIRAHELQKVVPAALCHVTSAAVLDVAEALSRVRAAYPECARFAFRRGDAVFVGASPEKLVSLHGLDAEADSLAGSRARSRDPGEDDRNVRALLGSDKDRREHRLVAEAIERALAPLSSSVTVPAEPLVRSLRNVHHLWTPITARLSAPAHVLDLVESLHPTPAVCGTPRAAAIDWIAAHEPAARGWYAGAVGWFDAAGDGAFSVAIRSGVVARHEAWLYAGAGIVEGSDPSAEYAETRVKHTPMLAALGLLP